MITIEEAAIECCPIRFDRIQVGASAFVTLYWIDNDPSIQGSVSYKVHAQGSTSLEDVNAFISRNQGNEFSGVWMLVAAEKRLGTNDRAAGMLAVPIRFQ